MVFVVGKCFSSFKRFLGWLHNSWHVSAHAQHSSFCSDIIGVQKQTTNIGVLLELGEVPLTIFAQKKGMKDWVRMQQHELTRKSCLA